MLDLEFVWLVRLLLALFVTLVVAASTTGLVVLTRNLWRMYKNSLPLRYRFRYLTDEQKQTLTQALVPFELSVDNYHEESVLVEAAHLKKVKRLLKAEIVYEFDAPGLTRTHELIARFSPRYDPSLRNFRITLHGRVRSQKSNLLSTIRNLLLPAVRKNIVVHSEPGTQAPVRDENFHVFLFASPQPTRHRVQTTNLWYTPVAAGTCFYETSGQGIPLVDQISGSVVGELAGNCLYIHGDVWQDSFDRNLSWLQYFRGFFKRTSGKNQRLGLLVRMLQNIVEELRANYSLEEVLSVVRQENEAITTRNRNGKIINTRSGPQADILNSLLKEILLPVIQNDIRVSNGSGMSRAPQGSINGSFTVFVNSSPTGFPFLEIPEKMFGCRLSRRGRAFAPSALGVPILDDAGFIGAEILDGNLYLHCDMVQCGTRSEATALAKLLIAVRKELAELGSLTEEALDSRLENQFRNQCLHMTNLADGANGSSLEAQLQSTQTDFSAQLTKTIAGQSEYFHIEEAPGDALGREFDALFRIPKVTAVDMTPTGLKVSTKVLYCVDPRTGKRHEIGAFEITISETTAVTWNNVTRKVYGGSGQMNAPHVNCYGHACLGNMKEVFYSLIYQRNFAAAAEAAIAFVESVNVNDLWGSHIHRWPEA